jgi:hypothetical protein
MLAKVDETVPEWATNDSYDRASGLVSRGIKAYSVHAEELEANFRGCFIVIDAAKSERYAIAKTELEAEAAFSDKFGSTEGAVLFQIGYVAA